MKETKVQSVVKSFMSDEKPLYEILNKNVRFSISLSTLQNARLESLIKKVDVTKQEFISKVIEAAMVDLEDHLNLIDTTYLDAYGSESYRYRTRYLKEIYEEVGLPTDDL